MITDCTFCDGQFMFCNLAKIKISILSETVSVRKVLSACVLREPIGGDSTTKMYFVLHPSEQQKNWPKFWQSISILFRFCNSAGVRGEGGDLGRCWKCIALQQLKMCTVLQLGLYIGITAFTEARALTRAGQVPQARL